MGETLRTTPPEPPPQLEEHFGDLDQQTHAAQLGMWVFLASEVLFFGVLFTLYAAYRAATPAAFATGAGHTDLLLGSANTYILLTASLLVACAVGAIRTSRARLASRLLFGAAALGVLFAFLKGLEYFHHAQEGLLPGRYYSGPVPTPGTRAFWNLYYLMTGLHLLHLTGGVVLLLWISRRTWRGDFTARWHTPLELGGMYWHFVDVVWLFLWPLFYLLR